MSEATRQETPDVASLLREKSVIVCTGAGGVGKTTVAAAMGLAATREGRRVLVVTIDPSRRLAETLGVGRNPPEPVPIPMERLRELGIEGEGRLSAWMLDPQLVANSVVKRFAKTPADARRLMDNPIYKNVAAMIAGMQEYTAVEALHGFVTAGTYDLVILDTPPSRNALSFLEAPTRVGRFLDRRIFYLFVPGEGGFIRRAATRLVEKVMDRAFGEDTRQDLQVFFSLFGTLLGRLNSNASEMRCFFAQPEVAFVVVTSPAREALDEAGYFASRTREVLGLDLVGYILNRSLADGACLTRPDDLDLAGEIDAVTRSALKKLQPYADQEAQEVDRHTAVLHQLRQRVGKGGLAVSLPYLSQGVDDLASLRELAHALVTPAAA